MDVDVEEEEGEDIGPPPPQEINQLLPESLLKGGGSTTPTTPAAAAPGVPGALPTGGAPPTAGVEMVSVGVATAEAVADGGPPVCSTNPGSVAAAAVSLTLARREVVK